MIRDMLEDIWYWFKDKVRKVKWSFINANTAFFETLFPNYSWKKKMEQLNPVIQFPSKIRLKQIEEDGFVGFKVVEPQTYGLIFMYRKDSVEPVRRAFSDCLFTLYEFAAVEGDGLPVDLNIEIKFEGDPTIRISEDSKAFTVAESEVE